MAYADYIMARIKHADINFPGIDVFRFKFSKEVVDLYSEFILAEVADE